MRLFFLTLFSMGLLPLVFSKRQPENRRESVSQQPPSAPELGAISESLTLGVTLQTTLNLTFPDTLIREALQNYQFRNRALLLKALLHPAYKAKERNGSLESYEPLDFIGDFVLDYIVSKYLLMNAKAKTKAFLASARSSVIRQDALALIAAKNLFHRYIFLDGKQEKVALERFLRRVSNVQKSSDLGGMKGSRCFLHKHFKAVAGAIYVDSGNDLSSVSNIFLKMLKPELDMHCN